MKKITTQQYGQGGFALLEVMIAALVLTVGGVAYMKLQQTGLQYNFNNAARSRGAAVINGFVEHLRSNVNYVRYTNNISGSIVADGVTEPSSAISCSSRSDTDSKTATCATAVFNLHRYLLSKRMADITAANNSRLCYVESSTEAGLMRLTFQWRDNSKESVDNDALSVACPDFNANLKNSTTNYKNNSVTIYAQL